MCTVVNKRTHTPTPHDIYIGRPSKFGNPFVIGRDGDRAQVVRKYRAWLWAQMLNGKITNDELRALRGKYLVCFCAPLACHGDELKRAVAYACTKSN